MSFLLLFHYSTHIVLKNVSNRFDIEELFRCLHDFNKNMLLILSLKKSIVFSSFKVGDKFEDSSTKSCLEQHKKMVTQNSRLKFLLKTALITWTSL